MKKMIVITIGLLAGGLMLAQAADTKETFESNCAKCHGSDGKGDTKMGKKLNIKDYTDAKVQAALKDEVALKSLKDGLKDKDGNVLMKPAEGLTDADLKALVAYVRAFKK